MHLEKISPRKPIYRVVISSWKTSQETVLDSEVMGTIMGSVIGSIIMSFMGSVTMLVLGSVKGSVLRSAMVLFMRSDMESTFKSQA